MEQEPTNIHRYIMNEIENKLAIKKIKEIQESWNKRNVNKLIMSEETTTITMIIRDKKQRKTHLKHKMPKSKESMKRGKLSKVDVEIQRRFKDLATFIENTLK